MASTVKVTRWSRSEAPAEADLRGSMLAQGLAALRLVEPGG